MRFRLRTRLIVLAVGPMVLAGAWWKVQDWRIREAAVRDWINHQAQSEVQNASPDEN